MSTGQAKSPYGYRYIGTHRRTKEDPRFVTGRGRYAADIALPGLKHVALVASPHASARILSISTDAARAMPGVHYVLTGEEFCAATDSLAFGVDAPKLTRWALAREQVRYAGEWVAAVVADSRALAEDAAELIDVEYEPLPHVTDPEQAMQDSSPLVHPAHGSNVILDRHFVWGPVEDEFAKAEHQIGFRSVCSPLMRARAAASMPVLGVCARRRPPAVSPSTSETRAPLSSKMRRMTASRAGAWSIM